MCRKEADLVLRQCTWECEAFNINCQFDCLDQFSDNLEKCPCGDKCSDGCPCDEWSCHLAEEEPEDRHDHIHMLILNPKQSVDYPAIGVEPTSSAIKVSLVDLDIMIDERQHEVTIEVDDSWQAYSARACNFVHQDKMYIAHQVTTA